MITASVLSAIMPTLHMERAELFAPYIAATCAEFNISTPIRQAAFIAQCAHESAELLRLRENLNYSAGGLLKTWPTRFTKEKAEVYARRPAAIANYVYKGRLGNGDEQSGDGWAYRGGGLIQLTGRNLFSLAGRAIGVPLDISPELIEHPETACRTSGWYWELCQLNTLADIGDFTTLTKRINSRLLGITERRVYWARAKSVLELGPS